MANIRSENLAAFLKAKRGSQQAIAKALSIKPPTVSEWKSGKRPVPVEHIPVICEILGVKEDDLCQPFSALAQKWVKTEEGQMLLKLLPKLSEDGLKQVLLTALQSQQSEIKH